MSTIYQNPSKSNPPGRGRLQLLLLAAIFAAPVIGAYLVYLNPEWQPSGKINRGQLVSPARTLPVLQLVNEQGEPRDNKALQGKWSLVLLTGANCAIECQKKLFELRQIRILQNQHIGRVQRVLWAPDAQTLTAVRSTLSQQQPELYADLVLLAGAGAHEFFAPADPLAVYIVDPLGNWLMSYPGGSNYQDILKDLKKLLRLSQIG